MIVGVLATCYTQYTWDRSMCIFLFNRTTLQVFVTYLTGALYMHPLWFYKHQHDNRARSKLFVACQRWWFQWRFWFVPSVPGYLQEEEEHKPDPWGNPIERNNMGLNLEKEVGVVKTPTIISNNPVRHAQREYVTFLLFWLYLRIYNSSLRSLSPPSVLNVVENNPLPCEISWRKLWVRTPEDRRQILRPKMKWKGFFIFLSSLPIDKVMCHSW